MGRNSNNHRLPLFPESGALLVDKPMEWTSHDVVNFVRRRFNIKKVGHCGTLDPAATGLLILVLGKATKLSQGLSGDDKEYEAEILLGIETDSLDLDGNVVSESDWSSVTEDELIEAVNSFQGVQDQIPPMVSAKKKNGKRLYELAREGKVIERDPVSITIHKIKVNSVNLPRAKFTARCSKGTYIRSLCSDIGKKLGCGATLSGLKRTESGIFKVESAVTVDDMKNWEQEELSSHMIPLDNL